MNRFLLSFLLFICLCTEVTAQSVGVNFVNHFSFQRDVLYSPGLALNFEAELSEKFDLGISVSYGENLGNAHVSDYKIDYKRTVARLDLMYVVKESRFNSIKVGLSPAYEFESFHQSATRRKSVQDFENKGVGVGIPILFQSKALEHSSLVFNIS